MPPPDRTSNALRRARLTRLLAPITRSVERHQVRCAPYALRAYPTEAQHNALINHAIELGGPPGMVIAREIPADKNGCTLEVLTGWERVEAYLHRDAFPHARQIPLATLNATDPDAAYYAIEHATQEHSGAGYPSSPLAYALAATAALGHFSTPTQTWSIQALANALCIARPTLSNRLRLLKGLAPRVRDLLDSGTLKPEFAKILLAERSATRQTHLAERAAGGDLSTRALYRLVHPGYEPPKRVQRLRRAYKQRLGDIGAMERALQENYGAPARISMDNSDEAAGFVDLAFHSLAELKGILGKLDRTAQTDTVFQGTLTFQATNPNDADQLLREMGATESLITTY
jgi:hypothetical protein